MKGKRFSEEQIIAVLKESEAGAKTKDLCRRHGISEPTFYNWKAKYPGMTVSEARRLKELKQENGKLKRLRVPRVPSRIAHSPDPSRRGCKWARVTKNRVRLLTILLLPLCKDYVKVTDRNPTCRLTTSSR